ncbi:MAG: GxxExxY protein [Verrucomicrobiaceae bacterium]|nr:GxxExxY protein [Verrucomicrobiaceae bacterium]
MTENQIAKAVVDVAYKLHTELGPGLLETVYEVLMEHELVRRGFSVRRQVPVPIEWNGVKFTEGFKADLIVNDLVIVELKSVEKLAPVHAKQLLTYLRLKQLRLGLLINFGEEVIKDGIKRVVNGLRD